MKVNGKIVTIIQARMGSTRLPGKVLKTIEGKPILWHIVNRLSNVELIDEIVIATSDTSIDDEVETMAVKYGITCFRGPEIDVLKRFFGAAKITNAEHVIRITGDCPLIDPSIIKKLIKLYFDGGYDFCGVACGAGIANEQNIKRFPDGMDAEIFSFKVLSDANDGALEKLYREHVTPFIWRNNKRYNIGTLYSENDYSDLRLTMDKKEDFDCIEWIYKMLYPVNSQFNLHDILVLLKDNPNFIQNRHLIGKEGYDEFWE